MAFCVQRLRCLGLGQRWPRSGFDPEQRIAAAVALAQFSVNEAVLHRDVLPIMSAALQAHSARRDHLNSVAKP